MKNEIRYILSSHGFNLTQWSSNHVSLLEVDQSQVNIQIVQDEKQSVKFLGLLWNPNKDEFEFSIHILLNDKRYTKRVILSTN